MRPIGKAALEHLQALPRLHDEFVFPNRDGTGRADLKKSIAEIFDAAGLTTPARRRFAGPSRASPPMRDTATRP